MLSKLKKIGVAIGLCPFFFQPTTAQSPIHGAVRVSVRERVPGQPGIPDATVTIVNLVSTNFRTRTTNLRGECIYDLVPQGIYRITAEADGYTQVPAPVLDQFVVVFGQVRVIEPPPIEMLKIPALPMPVQPTVVAPPAASAPSLARAAPPLFPREALNLEDARRSINFDQQTISALPLSGTRGFDQLALLAPGVAPPPQVIGDTVGPGIGPGVGTSGQFAVNGLRSRSNNFTVDGSDNNDEDVGVRRQGFSALVPQSLDSLKGFQIVTLLPRSESGRNLGAQVNAVSMDGGNQFHGAAYGFLTDRRLKARDAFDLTDGKPDILRRADSKAVLLNESPIQLPDAVKGENPFTRAMYGFVVGGPVMKNHSFFFASYEHQGLNAVRETNFAVPTVAERGMLNSGERGFRVSTTQGIRDVYPTTADGDAYVSLFPFPNNPSGPYGGNTYTEQLRADADGTLFSVRLERNTFQSLAGKHGFTARYNFSDDATALPTTGDGLFSSVLAKTRTQNFASYVTSELTKSLVSEARFSYGRTRLRFDEVRNPFLLPSGLANEQFLLNARKLVNENLPSKSEQDTRYLARPGQTTESNTDPIGQVIVSGYSPLGADVNTFPQRRANNTFQIADTLIHNRPSHRIIMGADLRRVQSNSLLARNFRPVALFGGSLNVAKLLNRKTAFKEDYIRGMDFAAASAATGFIQTLTLTPDSTIGLRLWQQNYFATDQISAGQTLRLTFGLRYELNTVPSEVNRKLEASIQSPEIQSFVAEETRLSGVSGLAFFLAGRSQVFRADRNNLAPYLAFAWAPFQSRKTALRGGYGIYYDQIPTTVVSQARHLFPFFLTLNLASETRPSFLAERELIAFNPARLAVPGSLNTYLPATGAGASSQSLLKLLLGTIENQSRIRNEFGAYPGGPNFFLPSANLVTPYAQHWGLTLERELRNGLFASLAYTGTRGNHLLRFATPNLGPNLIPPAADSGLLIGNQLNLNGFILSPGKDLRGANLKAENFKRPFPLLGSYTSIESDASSTYHSLQAEASLQTTWNLNFRAAYTWSHAIDEVSDLFELAGARGIPQNSFNREGERGDANFDVRHRLAANFVWDLPKRKWTGGWQLAGIVTLQTGQPFTVTSGIDVNLDGNLTDRLNSAAGIRDVGKGSLRYEFPAGPNEQFKLLADPGFDGAVGRNTFRAPGVAVVDLALNKSFHIRNRQQIEWRTECFNLFNRTHFGIPVHELFSPGLGRSMRTTIPARTVQFAVKYKF